MTDPLRKKLDRRAKQQMAIIKEMNQDKVITYGDARKKKSPSEIRSERMKKKLRIRDEQHYKPKY